MQGWKARFYNKFSCLKLQKLVTRVHQIYSRNLRAFIEDLKRKIGVQKDKFGVFLTRMSCLYMNSVTLTGLKQLTLAKKAQS